MLRVLHGPVNVGNQPWVLSRHERTLGVDSDLVVNFNTWLDYRVDRCLGEVGIRTPRTVLRRLSFGLSAPFRYDVIHCYFGLSFLSWHDFGSPNRIWFADVKLARVLGRKLFMTLQGCDVRISAESSTHNEFTPCHEGQCQAVATCRSVLDERRRHLVNHVLPYFDRVLVLNPELVSYVPRAQFVPYSSVDIDAFTPSWPGIRGPITIVHAPTDPGIKGSKLIIEAVERLKKRHPIEFILVQGLRHAEALEFYRKADLVIDQVLAGWYGGLAVEAMAMGKPVACYIRESDLDCLPEGMQKDLPIVRVSPDTLETDLERALERRAEWPEWGRRSREFVMRWHHPRKLAEAMVQAYRDPESRITL
jgi:glycosyltransferase involved in cell wall biosynthesis